MFLGEVFAQSSVDVPKSSTAILIVVMYLSLVRGKLFSFRPLKQFQVNGHQEPEKMVDPFTISETSLRRAIAESDQDGILAILRELERDQSGTIESVLGLEEKTSCGLHDRRLLQILEQQWHALSAGIRRRAIHLFIKCHYFEPLHNV